MDIRYYRINGKDRINGKWSLKIKCLCRATIESERVKVTIGKE